MEINIKKASKTVEELEKTILLQQQKIEKQQIEITSYIWDRLGIDMPRSSLCG
jgi:hypothetical protein